MAICFVLSLSASISPIVASSPSTPAILERGQRFRMQPRLISLRMIIGWQSRNWEDGFNFGILTPCSRQRRRPISKQLWNLPSPILDTRYFFLLFSGDGQELAATAMKEPARIWNMRDGTMKWLKPKSQRDQIMRVAFAPVWAHHRGRRDGRRHWQ